jgi:hypothetical protein
MKRGFAALLATFLCSCGSTDSIRPTVVRITPAAGSEDVQLDRTVSVVFSEAMACGATIASIALSSAAGPVIGAATCSGETLVFTPAAPLAASTTYDVVVDSRAADRAANTLALPFKLRFTTGSPRVTAVLPANGATGAALGRSISATFWESMDCGTVSAGTVRLVSSSGAVPGRVVCTGDRASFIPESPLAPSIDYTLFITSGVKDSSGNSLASFVSRFTTAGPADPVDPAVPDGAVGAMALSEDGKTLYLGGNFHSFGPRTGSLVPIDAASGKALPAYPKADGTIEAIAPDGKGGFYVGGSFGRIGSAARRGLAHILADGSVDASFQASVDGNVAAIAISGDRVFVGGAFRSLGGQPRLLAGAVDAATGAVTSWAPEDVLRPGPVQALAVAGSSVFVGGFDRLHVLDLATGAFKAWFPGPIQALAASGSTLFAGGLFWNFEAPDRFRPGLVAMDVNTFQVADWDLNSPGSFASANVSALAVSGSTLYVGGDFTTFGGSARNGLAAVDIATGRVTAWEPNPTRHSVRQAMRAIAPSGAGVLVAGDFTSIGGKARQGLAVVDAETGAATDWDPGPSFGVHALGVSGDRVLAGGEFHTLGGRARIHLAAVDAATGALSDWDPNAGANWTWGDGVWVLRVAGSTLYAGGQFSESGGSARSGLVALDTATGVATAWNPNPVMAQPSSCSPSPCPINRPNVSSIALAGSAVFVTGSYTEIGGLVTTNLVALDTVVGRATSWTPASGYVNSGPLAQAGSILLANANWDGGCGFATIDLAGGGEVVHPSAGTTLAWASSGTTVFAGGRFTSFGGQVRSGIAAFDVATGGVTSWDPDPRFSNPSTFALSPMVFAVSAAGSAVYAAGSFELIGGRVMPHLAALDAVTGAATAWNPGVNASIAAILATDSKVYLGGSFTAVGDEVRGGFAILSP